MKIAYIARDTLASRYIGNHIRQNGFSPICIFESGRKAKQRKLKRIFGASPIWKWPLRVIDLLFLGLMSFLDERYLQKRLGSHSGFKPDYRCDDVNDDEVRQLLQKETFDVVVVFGTAIIEPTTLRLCPVFLNIHTGIVPKYRNVHSEFWARLEGDLDQIGSTIMRLNESVDGGDIVLQRRLKMESLRTLPRIKLNNLILAAELAVEALAKFKRGELKFEPQSNEGRLWPTPSAREILYSWFKLGI